MASLAERPPRYDRQPVRDWRHLSWGRAAAWRVSCRRCRGVKVERVPSASAVGVFTSGFEGLAAYLAQVTDRTSVSRRLRISWGTVGSIVKRAVARRLDGARFGFHSAYALTSKLFLCCGGIELARRPYPHSFVRRP